MNPNVSAATAAWNAADSDGEAWSERNNRYLAVSLDWLRLRLDHLREQNQAAAATPAAAPARAPWWGRADGAPALPPPSSLAQRLREAEQERERAAVAEPAPALPALARRLGLNDFERDIVLLCAAAELDPALPAAIAAAHPIAHAGGSAHPSFGLALRLFDDPAWDALSPHRPLRHLRLLEINQPGATALTAAALRIDERILGALKGLDEIDERLSPLLAGPEPERPLGAAQQACAEEILAYAQAREAADAPAVVQLLGRDRGDRLAVAAHACARLSLALYRIAADALPSQRAEVDALARLWRREAQLLPVALYIEADEADAGGERAAALAALLAQAPGLAFVGLRDTALPLAEASWSLDVPPPSALEQQRAWREALPPQLREDERERQADRLSGHFQLDLAQIADTAREARARGVDAWDACRERCSARLESLAQRLQPKARWDDLVLGEESTGLLRQIAAQAHHRHRVYQHWGYARRLNRGMGISALFAGESGTGKTMAAEVIANELRLHLFRIDLSSVVSKYIGETEKNLRRVFDAAERGGALLFFDEADALFGKRSEVKDSHDRYANIEINYLLQRMEAFSGLAILATNMKASLDAAFLRRLRFVVNFQFPGPQERERMWRQAFPAEVPLAPLDYAWLARFNLSGGNIHSVALNAAFAAAAADGAVDMARLSAMVRAELRKLGKPVNEAEFRMPRAQDAGAQAGAGAAP
ncbi:ATP-binding protein [Lysobacter enzymogenes]|uniref:ATP-binding protein n=1 Tax=Lysobacter enzymogenes TaxID=69 RepID=UPI001A9639E6|nr:ATP-binding protein [Lysobacter enzymogenes]QQP98133.1 ATP-binding protein [Lysobacter enzymogenes]